MAPVLAPVLEEYRVGTGELQVYTPCGLRALTCGFDHLNTSPETGMPCGPKFVVV